MPKPDLEEIKEWAKSHKKGDKLIIEEAKATNTPVIETLTKVVEKL